MKPRETERVQRTRAPGRPSAGAPDHRAALVQAACHLFAEQGVAATSLRQIARRAQVTPALLHYYFADKAGLLEAVVAECIAPLVTTLADAVQPVPKDQPLAALQAFVRRYTRMASTHPWLPQLLVREVLNPQGALRATFPKRFAGGMAELLTDLIRAAQASGHARADLDPARVVMSIVALCIFPFIAAPLVVDTLGIAVDPDHAEELSSHHLSVLLQGITTQP